MKTSPAILAVLCLAIVLPAARGQTNAPASAPIATNAVITTNRVMADPAFRVVGGQLYNTDKSDLWEDFRVRIASVDDEAEGGPFYLVWRLRKVYRYGGAVWEPEKMIALKNFKSRDAAADNDFTIRAMRNGIYKAGSTPYEIWDLGQLKFYDVITTNWPAASGARKAKAP